MTNSPSRNGLHEFRRGWLPLLACGVGLGLGLSPIQPYASGIMASALHDAYGWPRAEILASLMVTPVALVLLSRRIGRLIDRIGPRKVAIGSTIGLGLAQLVLAAAASHLVTFFIAYALLAAVSIGTLPMTYAKLINGWFHDARGLALGLALAFTGLSGAIFPFLLTNMITRFGWRGGYVTLAVLPLCIALPVLLAWLREAPGTVNQDPVPGGKPSESHSAEVKAVLAGYRFRALAVASFALSFGVSGLLPNLYPILLEHGMPAAAVAGALAAMAISVTIGRILSGWLLDLMWAPFVAALLILPAAAAIALLLAPAATGWMITAAVVMLGLIAGAEFDLVAFMTAGYFGKQHFSELYSIQYAAFGVAAGFAPAIYGAIRDHDGNFAPAIALSVALLALSVVIYFTLGRYPDAEDERGDLHALVAADPTLAAIEGNVP